MAITDDQISAAIVGSTGANISIELPVALKSLANWPVDAYFVDLDTTGNQVVGWLDGNTIGIVTAQDVAAGVSITGHLYPVQQVRAVRVDVNVVANDAALRYEAFRQITVEFGGSESLTVDVGAQSTEHARRQANLFVDALLGKLAGRN